MKIPIFLFRLFFLAIIAVSACSHITNAQFLKNLKDQVRETVKQTVQQRASEKAGNATNTAIDKASNETDTMLRKVLKGGDKQSAENGSLQSAGSQDNIAAAADNAAVAVSEDVSGTAATNADYKSYDFVPGDKIIFEPDLSTEPDAELPARFTLNEGNAEIQSYNGEKILHIDIGSHEIVSPMMDSDSYLPEQFTVEFDMMYENPDNYFRYSNSFVVQFRAPGDNNYGNFPLYLFSIENGSSGIWGKRGTPSVHFPDAVSKSLLINNAWHHIAIYIRKNIGKVYIDQYRVAASNTMPTGAGHLAIEGDGHYGFKIKNMRIAAGGDDKYNKIVTEGKFITHGILFDVNKADIKPESMGVLNEIASLMQAHTDLKFEIDGHTDSDGNADANMQLSQARADAVKAALTGMGIDGARLTTKGFGATKPVDSNDTAEGKANNRRVEFVKN